MYESDTITAETPVTLDEMTNEDLANKLERSRQQIQAGEGVPMNEVFEMLEGRIA